MYKCSYCDSVFMEYQPNCPNCGGCNWLTNGDSVVPKDSDINEVLESESTDCSNMHDTLAYDTLTVITTILLTSITVFILLTSDAFSNIVNFFLNN